MKLTLGLLSLCAAFPLWAQLAVDLPGQPKVPRLPPLKPVANQPISLARKTEAGLLAPATQGGPLSALPARLDILDVAQRPLLTEVQVEGGWRAIEHEWAILIDASEQAELSGLPLEILSQQPLPALDMTLIRFKVSPALDSRQQLLQILPAALADRLDRNHVFATQQGTADSNALTPPIEACTTPLSIGMIDTAIDISHPAFAGAQITQGRFLPGEMDLPLAHGTAVAALLVGRYQGLSPLLPQARLFAASAFYRQGSYAQGATLVNLVESLEWLASQPLSVINLSLAGPDNRVLSTIISRIAGQGIGIVAAVGNEGPAAPPLYPAAYPRVIGVTATDKHKAVYRWANRGEQVDFAAPGVSVITARQQGLGRESGTSMATPVVAAMLACEMANGQLPPEAAINRLIQQAEDLGAAGRDPVFGHGLLRP